jgi:acyl-CoA synthetase (AMP-forming)/AMP-acid ligase II
MAISPLKEAMEIKAKYLPGDRTALVWGDRRISWKQINARTDLLASALHHRGVRKGQTCAFLFYNQPEFIETNLAIQTVGGIPVPVNFRYVADELQYVLENCEAECFLFHRNALPLVRSIQGKLPRLKTLICSGEAEPPAGVHSYESLIAHSDGVYPRVHVSPDDIAVIIYTGGTTGRPKGVMLTYENFRSNQEAIFSFLVHLLPPVAELSRPEYARSEMQRKILGLFAEFARPVAPLLYAAAKHPRVVLMEVQGKEGVTMPPLAVTLREGKPKIFVGAPEIHDFRIRIRMGDDFRKFIEMSYYPHTWRGKLAVVPRLIRLLLSGGLKTEGPVSMRLRMTLESFRTPPTEPIQHIALIPPLFHLASYSFWITFWLYQQGSVYLPPGPDFKSDDLLRMIEEESIAWLLLVPTLWKRVLKNLRTRPRTIQALRVALTGAAVMPAAYKREILEFFPNALIVDGFGQTEMAPVTTIKVDADLHTVRERSVGTLLQGLEVKIVNDQGEESSAGDVGELWYRGSSVMKGYFHDPEKTGEVLDPDGWFHSGDLAFRGDDGELYTVERKKECINSGGEKIFPQEVEEILLRHPAVEEVCVLGVPDEEWGESVRAVVVPRDGEELTAEELINWCTGKMAGFKKPKSVFFTRSLPMSPVGKILRAKIRETYGHPNPVR